MQHILYMQYNSLGHKKMLATITVIDHHLDSETRLKLVQMQF